MIDHENSPFYLQQNSAPVPAGQRLLRHMKPGRKVTGQQRPLRFPLVMNTDEKDYITLKAKRLGITMSEFVRDLIFPVGWQDDLKTLRRRRA